MHVFPVTRDDGVETDGQTVSTSRRLWRLDSDIEIDLDRMPARAPSVELDLTIPQRTKKEDSGTLRKSILKGQSRDANLSNKNDMSKKGQSVASGKSRPTAKQSSDRSSHESRSSRVQSASDDRRSPKRRSRRDESSDSCESLPCSQNRPRHPPSHSRRDGIPPEYQ